jgi:hypothetical protein
MGRIERRSRKQVQPPPGEGELRPDAFLIGRELARNIADATSAGALRDKL